jgi:WD40 repeat protein
MKSATDAATASNADLFGADEGGIPGGSAAGAGAGGTSSNTSASTSPTRKANSLRVRTVLQAGKKLLSNLTAETLKRLPVHLDDLEGGDADGGREGQDGEDGDGGEWERSPLLLGEETFGRSIKPRLKHKATTDFEYLIKVQQLGHVPPPATGPPVTGPTATLGGHGLSASISYGLRPSSQSSHLATMATTMGAPVPKVLRDESAPSEEVLATLRHGIRGPVWCMKFSGDGKLLAAAGEDGVVRLWALLHEAGYTQPKGSTEMTPETPKTPSTSSGTPPKGHGRAASSLFGAHATQKSALTRLQSGGLADGVGSTGGGGSPSSSPPPSQVGSLEAMHHRTPSQDALKPAPTTRVQPVFRSRPFRIYTGHTGPILDLAFSKSNFLISASMDKTVRLWHVTQRECLCAFEHPDAVTVGGGGGGGFLQHVRALAWCAGPV